MRTLLRTLPLEVTSAFHVPKPSLRPLTRLSHYTTTTPTIKTTTTNMSSAKQFAENAWRNPEIAAQYARSERATGPYAQIMVEQADSFKTLDTSNKDLNVLDLACGTGAVTSALYTAIPREQWGKAKVIGGDISESMLAYLKERGEKDGWSGLETRNMDLNDPKLPANSLTHIFLNFGIFFSPPTVLSTYHSLLQPGGFIAISTWQAFPWYSFFVQAAERYSKSIPTSQPQPPALPTTDELTKVMYSNRDWDQESFIVESLEKAGFEGVKTVVKAIEADVGTPEQFLESMGMPILMITKGWGEGEGGEEQKGKWLEGLKAELLTLFKEVADEAEGGVVTLTFKGLVAVGVKGA